MREKIKINYDHKKAYDLVCMVASEERDVSSFDDGEVKMMKNWIGIHYNISVSSLPTRVREDGSSYAYGSDIVSEWKDRVRKLDSVS